MSAPVRGRKGLQVAGFLALWFSVPVSIILVGGLPIADDLRAFLLPLILFYLVWPPIGLVSLICAMEDTDSIAIVASKEGGLVACPFLRAIANFVIQRHHCFAVQRKKTPGKTDATRGIEEYEG